MILLKLYINQQESPHLPQVVCFPDEKKHLFLWKHACQVSQWLHRGDTGP